MHRVRSCNSFVPGSAFLVFSAERFSHKLPQMRIIHPLICLFTVLLLCGSTSADTITLAKGAITFEVPEGFTALDKEEVELKFPSSRAPRYVMGNEKRSVTVAFDFKPFGSGGKANDSVLPKLQEVYEGSLPRLIPGLEWIKKEIVEINGKQWLCMELTSSAVDTDIHNMMLITTYEGDLFMANFNSTKREFPEVEKELRRCIQTLVVDPSKKDDAKYKDEPAPVR